MTVVTVVIVVTVMTVMPVVTDMTVVTVVTKNFFLSENTFFHKFFLTKNSKT